MDLINEIKFLISIVLVVISNSDSENFLFMNVLMSILDLILSSLINLFLFFKFATTVFLGKSLIKGGGQNPLEPARFGTKILHGPSVDNFKDVYKYLRQLKISTEVSSPQKCASSIIFRKNMKKVKKMKYLGTTILKKTLNELDKSIHNEI